jgi:hypothetical protein
MATPKQQMANFNKEVKKLLKKVTNKKAMIEYGKLAIGAIVHRTRNKGQGLKKSGGTPSKLKQVTVKYADQRRRMKDKHPSAATGRKSNLTLTGEMLDSLVVIDSKNKEVELGWFDEKQEAKAAGNESRGREFLNLSTKEIKLISKKLDENLSKEAKKI